MTRGKVRIIPNFLIILILFSGCATENSLIIPKDVNLSIETTTKVEVSPEKIDISKIDLIDSQAESLLEEMTIDEKIGQLFILAVRNSYNGSRMLHADEFMADIIDKYKPGGIILFAVNFANPVQTRDLIRGTQLMSNIPLFIAVDEEGGKVARLGNTGRMSVTLLPPAALIGKTGNTEFAGKAAGVIATELKALGFNMNMAPVADVNTNPHNSVIGNRTYSSDPVEAGKMVAAVTETFQFENIVAVLKHYPGHGDTSEDTHMGDVVLKHTKERLDSVEFIPFKMGIEAGVDAIMTAHIKVPFVTGTDLPATMSSVLLKDILRKELGFNGIIITDAMDMGAVKKYWTADTAAVNALTAGVDIILMPSDISLAISGIKEALNNGTLTIKRLNESVRRILKVKFKQNIMSDEIPGADNLEKYLSTVEHKKIINSILQ